MVYFLRISSLLESFDGQNELWDTMLSPQPDSDWPVSSQ